MASWFDRLAGGTRGRLLARLRCSARTINDLAGELGISDNAVRTHIASLQRDGMVEEAGYLRSTGGKPAQLYRITREAEELFPKAYAYVLGELIDALEARDGREEVVRLLRQVGVRAAAAQGVNGADPADRVSLAVNVLRELGGEVDVERTEGGWVLRGHGCPLSAVVTRHSGVCAMAEALVEALAGRPVRECCERGDRPRCAFRIAAEQAG